MPNPKRRHSKARRNKRRAHDALTKPNFIACTNCGEYTQRHRICQSCGHYNGKQVENKESAL